MKTEEILNLDFRKEESKFIIQKALKKISFFSKFENEDVPIEAIELFIGKVSKKYDVLPQNMRMFLLDNGLFMYAIDVKKMSNYEYLWTIHGICLYEVFAKLAINLYVQIKKGNICHQKASKEEMKRERLSKKAEILLKEGG